MDTVNQRCPRCGARLEYVADGEVNVMAEPFFSCATCEYCAKVRDQERMPPPRFMRLFRSQMQRVLYAVISMDGGYVVTRAAAETLGHEPPDVVNRFPVEQLAAACRDAASRARRER